MAVETTQALAQFAAELKYDDLPDRVREHVKNVLLDTLACAVAGHQGEETDQVTALAAALAESKEASVIAGDRLSLAGATLLNGYLVTAVTMCDIHRPTLTHVTPEVVPPALALNVAIPMADSTNVPLWVIVPDWVPVAVRILYCIVAFGFAITAGSSETVPV